MGKLRITNNDLLLFKYLFEENYVHRMDIIEFFNDYHRISMERRLGKLRKEKYIKYVNDPGGTSSYVFPKRKALNIYDYKYEDLKDEVKMKDNSYIKYYSPKKYSIKNNLDINNLRHDRKLTQLRFIMEDIGVDYWQRETMYYNKYKKNPDAIFEIQGKKYAIELEKNFKDEKRYEKIFEKFGNVKDINFNSIIYITTKDFVYNKLKNVINDIVILGMRDRDWKSNYRLSKFDDFKNGKFKFYKPYSDEMNDLTEGMKKYVNRKKR